MTRTFDKNGKSSMTPVIQFIPAGEVMVLGHKGICSLTVIQSMDCKLQCNTVR